MNWLLPSSQLDAGSWKWRHNSTEHIPVIFKWIPKAPVPTSGNEGSGVPRGGVEVFEPPPEIPKALHNCAKLNPIWENC